MPESLCVWGRGFGALLAARGPGGHVPVERQVQVQVPVPEIQYVDVQALSTGGERLAAVSRTTGKVKASAGRHLMSLYPSGSHQFFYVLRAPPPASVF